MKLPGGERAEEIQVARDTDIAEVQRLFREYAAWVGVDRILLDTLPAMDRAQRLYVRLGFQEVAPYRPNPVPGARFLELVLE